MIDSDALAASNGDILSGIAAIRRKEDAYLASTVAVETVTFGAWPSWQAYEDHQTPIATGSEDAMRAVASLYRKRPWSGGTVGSDGFVAEYRTYSRRPRLPSDDVPVAAPETHEEEDWRSWQQRNQEHASIARDEARSRREQGR